MLGILAGIGAGLNVVGGISKMISGSKRERQARKALEDYRRQTLTNAYDGVGVSTLGADLQREENARTSATTVDALRSMGTRGLAGLAGITAQNNVMNRSIAADLDRQRQSIEMAKAQDEARIRQLQERREEQDLAGLGRAMEVGRQDAYSGLGDIAQGFTSFGNILGTSPQTRPQVKTLDIKPQGLAGMGGFAPQAPVLSGSPYFANPDTIKPYAPMMPGTYNQITAPLL